MQAFCNVVSAPVRKTTKASGKAYWQIRVAESQKNDAKGDATFYDVRVMKDEDPELVAGDFVRVTGRLKGDAFMSRDGKPQCALLILAFEATKLSKGAKVAKGSEDKGQRIETTGQASSLPLGVAAGVATGTEEDATVLASSPVSVEAEMDMSWLQLMN